MGRMGSIFGLLRRCGVRASRNAQPDAKERVNAAIIDVRFFISYEGIDVYIILDTLRRSNWFHLNVFKVSLLRVVMKRILFLVAVLFLVGVVSAVPETGVSYFYSVSCSHCANVADSGVLERVALIENVSLEKFEIGNPIAREKFLFYQDKFRINNGGIPFLVIEQGGEFSYLEGDTPIINGLEHEIVNFRAVDVGGVDEVRGKLTLWVVVAAALIDSINPCAFGVLLFLMAVLLSMGSAKRALRSGVIYTFVIFFVYLAAGFGIMRMIGGFGILSDVKLIAGVIVLIGGLIELKDFFWEGKGFSLKIPTGVKPAIEKYVHRGTLPALVVLGALVALVELPCTGGIYLAILSLISESGTVGIFYLILYNLIFILPLILISYFVYRGAKVDVINRWVQKNKGFMRLAAGLIMLFLAANLLGFL